MQEKSLKSTWLGGVGVVVGVVLWFAHTFHLPFYAMMFFGIGTSHFAMNPYIKIAGVAITLVSVAWIVYKLISKKNSDKCVVQSSDKY